MSDAEFTLSTPLAQVKGVPLAAAEALAALGLRAVGHLIAHAPMRYEWHQGRSPIAELADDQIVTAEGEVTATRLTGMGRKPRFEAVLVDDTGRLDLVWFNAPYLRRTIHPGMRLRVRGKAKRRGPGLQIVNPRHSILPTPGDPPAGEPPPAPAPAEADEEPARLVPVYPASEAISSERLSKILLRVLPRALPLIDDHLPDEFRRSRELPPLADAYRMLHEPADESEAAAARRRLAYDELLIFQLALAMQRAWIRATAEAPALECTAEIDAAIVARFPFPLTGAQRRVCTQLAADLARTIPASRLVQGDVGSGKTAVALYAMLLAVAHGKQAALMAPTELLAEQHYNSISALLEGSRVRTRLLTGSLPAAQRTALEDAIAAGDVDLVIGTHALISASVRFRALAVSVIDEQHRFGVHQRAALRERPGDAGPGPRPLPHTIVMTATPIPRTLAVTLFGDLDLSILDELPPGRTPVETRVVPRTMSTMVYDHLRTRVERGEQGYVVVPAIDSGESGPAPGDLREVHARLEAGPLAGRRVAVVHGRMKPDERNLVMYRFRQRKIDVLVATTVIEVGVDVPTATVMIVEHAERFGLAQLHQLRGRVGRGGGKSLCVLLADPTTDDARARLEVLARTTDGFEIAERDFEIRGPGEVLGLKQSGAPPFRVADLIRDADLLHLARRDAAAWIERSPALGLAEESLLRRRVVKAHGKWLGLADVG